MRNEDKGSSLAFFLFSVVSQYVLCGEFLLLLLMARNMDVCILFLESDVPETKILKPMVLSILILLPIEFYFLMNIFSVSKDICFSVFCAKYISQSMNIHKSRQVLRLLFMERSFLFIFPFFMYFNIHIFKKHLTIFH